MIRAGMQIPNFTYPGVAPDQLFDRIADAAVGVDFPPVKERVERLEEALHICRAMFRGERPTFEGKHYRVKDVINSPAPITPGGPPIMIGGQGEKKTLRLMAEHADMANFTAGFDEIPRKLEVLAH